MYKLLTIKDITEIEFDKEPDEVFITFKQGGEWDDFVVFTNIYTSLIKLLTQARFVVKIPDGKELNIYLDTSQIKEDIYYLAFPDQYLSYSKEIIEYFPTVVQIRKIKMNGKFQL